MTAQDTYTRLLETALDLIWHSNYASVGINDICKQAGVTKGGFYHHFDSKVSLFCEATEYYWEAARKELDAILSPSHSPLEQMENMMNFIFARKFGDDPDNMPGCPFLSAGSQTGSGEDAINATLMKMTQYGLKYTLALVRNLHSAGYLEDGIDTDRAASRVHQYIQGAVGYARLTRDIASVKAEMPEGLYRLVGLKREYWFVTKATWQATCCCLRSDAAA